VFKAQTRFSKSSNSLKNLRTEKTIWLSIFYVKQMSLEEKISLKQNFGVFKKLQVPGHYVHGNVPE